jgi:hypothetical protein
MTEEQEEVWRRLKEGVNPVSSFEWYNTTARRMGKTTLAAQIISRAIRHEMEQQEQGGKAREVAYLPTSFKR